MKKIYFFYIGYTTQFSNQSPRIIRNPDNASPVNQKSTYYISILKKSVCTAALAEQTTRTRHLPENTEKSIINIRRLQTSNLPCLFQNSAPHFKKTELLLENTTVNSYQVAVPRHCPTPSVNKKTQSLKLFFYPQNFLFNLRLLHVYDLPNNTTCTAYRNLLHCITISS
jgi:hypothetical protein